MAMSSDFFEIFLPNPVPFSELITFTGFLVTDSTCPLACNRPRPGGSASFPLAATGEGCLLVFISSAFPFTVMAAPGLHLPADTGLSGKQVLRFGGASFGKSGRLMGWARARARETGELGLDVCPTLRLLKEGVGLLLVGVDGLMILSTVVVSGRLLEGVGREDAVDGLATDVGRLVGVDGLM